MTTLYERAYAKINLTLDVLGRREDGFHDLQTIMQSLSLGDDIEIDVETGRAWSLSCNRPEVPCDSSNLAWKAAEVFEKAIGKSLGGVAIRMTKRIPSQAGMGGGSADAAAVLRALNHFSGFPFPAQELAQLGAAIGSDVPFCVVGGTCMCEGRGERLRVLAPLPKCPVVICKPDFGVSTPALYRRLDETDLGGRPDNPAVEQALLRGDLEAVAAGAANMFDPVVSAEHPQIGQIKQILRENGALGQQMTGSGSAVFGLMPDEQAAERAAGRLRQQYSCVFVCEPV